MAPPTKDTPATPVTPATPPAARLPRGVRLVLFLSLAMNLLVVGLVAGFMLRGGPDGAVPRHTRDVVAPYTEALTREDRREIGRTLYGKLREEGSRLTLRARARAEYQQALGLLQTQPFDAAAFAAVLDLQNRRAAERQRRGQEALVAHVAAMSPEARAAFADRLAEVLDRRDRKRK